MVSLVSKISHVGRCTGIGLEGRDMGDGYFEIPLGIRACRRTYFCGGFVHEEGIKSFFCVLNEVPASDATFRLRLDETAHKDMPEPWSSQDQINAGTKKSFYYFSGTAKSYLLSSGASGFFWSSPSNFWKERKEGTVFGPPLGSTREKLHRSCFGYQEILGSPSTTDHVSRPPLSSSLCITDNMKKEHSNTCFD
nr:PREDICTED: uncharacterized protein LOC108952273 [Musa acuminata subsp. malaccensis]